MTPPRGAILTTNHIAVHAQADQSGQSDQAIQAQILNMLERTKEAINPSLPPLCGRIGP